MKLIDRIRAGHDSDYWPLQVILDTLAATKNVSLRCISTLHARNLFHQESQLGHRIRKQFKSEDSMWQAIAELSADPARGITEIRSRPSLWQEVFAIDPHLDMLLIPSFTSPLFVLLREYKAWSIWETTWYLNNSVRHSKTRSGLVGPPISFGGAFRDRMYAVCLWQPDLDMMIFAGPVWQPWTLDTSERDLQSQSEAVVGEVLDLLEIPPEQEPGLSRDRIFRHALARAPLTIDDLTSRATVVARSLQVLLEAELPEIQLAAREYEALALHALLLSETPSERLASQVSSEHWEMPLPRGEHTHERQPERAALVLRVGAGPTFQTQILEKPLQVSGIDATGPRTPYGDDYNTYYDRANINRTAYMLERINLLRLWLQSALVALPISGNASSESVQILNGLSRRILLLFGADGCNIYRYETSEQILNVVGSFFRPEMNADSDRAAELMRTAAHDPALRNRSLAYKCIDSGDTIFEAHARDEDMVATDAQSVPRHVLIIPLLFNGRAWGVIEILALHPYQLLESSIRWAKELTRAIMPILYDRLLLQKLSEMNSVVLSQKSTREKYELILRDLSALLLASSGALYLQNPRRTGDYDCTATFGRRAGQIGERLPGFAADDQTSISAKLLRTKKQWDTGKIGEPPFGGDWLRKPKNAALRDDGHLYAAIFCLLDSQGRSFGSVTMTSKTHAPFSRAWGNLILFLSRHVGVLIETIKKQSEMQDARREYQAHAVKTRVDRVLGGVSKVEERLNPFFGENNLSEKVGDFLKGVEIVASVAKRLPASISPDALEIMDSLRALFNPIPTPSLSGNYPFLFSPAKELSKILGDLKEHAADLRVSAVYMSGGENEEDPEHATPETWRGTWADLRGCVLSAIKPIHLTRNARAIRAPIREELPVGVRVRMPPTQLQEILNNIVDNAYKYNHMPDFAPFLACRIFQDRGVEIEIRNLAPALTRREERNVGRPRIRAGYARHRNKDGVGLGLAYCYEEARRWGASFNYVRDNPSQGSGQHPQLVWHKVQLSFAAKNVKIEE
jgi:signal transduction histidine kinase